MVDEPATHLASRRRLPGASWLWWAAASAVGYLVSARLAGAEWHPGSAYFDELADAFLSGRLHLSAPSGTHDLTQYDGRWFVPFPPLPALLMLPFIAVLGVDGMSTLVFVAVVGGVNVGLAHLVLRATVDTGLARLNRVGVHWLTAAWAFGSVHWYMSTQGSVWFVAQICSATFVLAAFLLALHGRVALAASMVAVAMLSRPTLVLVVPAVVVLAVRGRDVVWPRLVVRVAAPLAAAVAALAVYNAARFASVTDFGYADQNVARELERDLRQRGQFSLAYVKHNLWAALASGPTWDARARTLTPHPDGMSMLLTTPALLLAGQAARSRTTLALWIAVALTAAPLLTYYNTGWYQFGYRFALDVMPMLWILMAIGAGARLHAGWRIAIVVGIAVNAWGLAWFV